MDQRRRATGAPRRLRWGRRGRAPRLGVPAVPSGDYLAELGVGGTGRVLDAVTDAGVPHLVHMSSVGAYSPKRDDSPVDETGRPTACRSMYSRHKVAAERLLDLLEGDAPETVVARIRPGIVGQRNAGSALLRYGSRPYFPPHC